jgi:hypothetical protein
VAIWVEKVRDWPATLAPTAGGREAGGGAGASGAGTGAAGATTEALAEAGAGAGTGAGAGVEPVALGRGIVPQAASAAMARAAAAQRGDEEKIGEEGLFMRNSWFVRRGLAGRCPTDDHFSVIWKKALP